MEQAFAHPFTLAADLLVNGTRAVDVTFIGVQRFGNTGIIGMIIEFFNSLGFF